MIKGVLFIGFGEVGSQFSRVLVEKGVSVLAFDMDPEKAKQRAIGTPIKVVATVEEALQSAQVIFSCVWPNTALEIAKRAASILKSGQYYLDVNSISPETTRRILETLTPSGASFVKLGVMAAVTDRGSEVPMLAGGKDAEFIASWLGEMGFQVKAISSDPCQPSAIKILRSICLKGLVALAYEMVLAGHKYGVERKLLDSASEVMDRESFGNILEGWIKTTLVHAGRRAAEMDEVIETVREAGISPTMSTATKKVFESIANAKMIEALKHSIPSSLEEILSHLSNGNFGSTG